ncbi:MAG TPA: 5-(carboxyamino)imidazole ribonucleotide synthase [Kiritimatiellia bacterium]|nr:5-(carboxyamino)imidazole ribonucleotide synthase [Kiritimatiellia bacterium]
MNKVNFQQNLPTIGILGGGQLAKMIALSAYPLGISVKVCVKKGADALPGITGDVLEADWNDPNEVLNFSQHVDIVTLENEFVNQESLELLEKSGKQLVPSSRSIRLIQDKWLQKESLLKASLPIVSCQAVESARDVVDFANRFGWPVVLKRRHEGYDGKGNATIHNECQVDSAWEKLQVNQSGLFVEAFCPFEREIAVMVCRSISGEVATYPVVDTVQKDHICHIVRAPSSLNPDLSAQAKSLALSAIESIDGHGVMGVEMFVTTKGDILINELAPRVHNSGHYTIEACFCSQFENHVRAILGWPLGSTNMKWPAAVMVNLLGQGDGPARPMGLETALAMHGANIHIYGKNRSARGRKMGHVTATGNTIVEAEAIAITVAESLRFGAT